MPVTVKVNGMLNALSHKGSNHIANSTAPDVCKTPSPAGPVPIPYPIIVSMSSDLVKGTTTVKADGGNSCCVKDCELSRCTGDEPGTAGGVVSNVNMKEAKFILFSFDVKLDGKNACRFSDKLTMNHMNTICMVGLVGPTVTVPDIEKFLNEIADKCNKQVNQDEGKCPGGPSGEECTRLGTLKHTCCENEINKHKDANPKQSPQMQSEVAFDGKGKVVSGTGKSPKQQATEAYDNYIQGHLDAGKSLNQARGYARNADVYYKALKAAGGEFIADVLLVDPPGATPTKGPPSNIKGAYDFKFNCKPEGEMEDTQIRAYKRNTGCTPKMIHKDGRQC